jgi:hydroxylamine reductase (hybrid-cluster protein)
LFAFSVTLILAVFNRCGWWPLAHVAKPVILSVSDEDTRRISALAGGKARRNQHQQVTLKKDSVKVN